MLERFILSLAVRGRTVTLSRSTASCVMEVLNREVFYSVKEAKVMVESWQLEYNNHRPHSGLDYITPAEFAASCIAGAEP
jgi:transposase InsO family protein